MMEIFYYGCEFLYTAAIVWSIFDTIDVTLGRSIKIIKRRRVKYVTILIVAIIKVLNVYTGSGLFSNILLLIGVTIIAVVSKIYLRNGFWASWLIGNTIWGIIAIGDFFVQTLIGAYLQLDKWNKVLLTVSVHRGIYLLIWTIFILVYISKMIPKAEYVFRTIFTHRAIWIASIVIVSCQVYFQRIYVVDITENYLQRWWIFFLGIILSIVVTVFYYVKEKEKNNYRLLQMKCELLENQYKQILIERKEKDILLHDMKNHLLTISGLAEDGQTVTIQSYISEMYHRLERKGNYSATGQALLDLILDQKLTQVHKLGIVVKIETSDLSDLALSEMEICALFSNLLDNAIEANEKLDEQEDRWMKIVCKRQRRLLIVNIMNPTAGSDFHGELPITSKANKAAHGFGLRSIQKIVNEHEGIMKVRMENGVFNVYICLCAFK